MTLETERIFWQEKILQGKRVTHFKAKIFTIQKNKFCDEKLF